MAKHVIHLDKEVEKLKIIRQPLNEKCSKMIDSEMKVCSRGCVESGMNDYCQVYAFPSSKWRLGDCPMADDFLRTEVIKIIESKKRVGQQKQKKKK